MRTKFFIACLTILTFSACNFKQKGITIKVINNSDIECANETLEISIADLGISDTIFINKLELINVATNQKVLSQKLDSDNDGEFDKILFQPKVAARAEVAYKLEPLEISDTITSKVYSRFVPERTDDYAWENDRVAFRTYGPNAQQLAEAKDPNGTLSSGMDCWLKRVDYSIINKWYKKHTTGAGSYHKDTGEGYDPYHVGSSRGCGGLGVYKNGKLYVSKNFTAYKTLCNGPLRTAFLLDYANWQAGEQSIVEQKMITLDLGNNLMKIEAKIIGTDEITVGLTLHENSGTTAVDTVNGWFSYWQALDDSELGTGIVINPEDYRGYTKVVSDEKDKSQLLIHLKVTNGKAVYYAGFGWKKSGQFINAGEWNNYLKQFAQELNRPLKVSIVN